MAPVPRSSIKLDIATAYLASATKVVAWAAVSGIVFRYSGAEGLGLLALVRATIGILNYTTLGLGPAMVQLLAQRPKAAVAPDAPRDQNSKVLDYAPSRQHVTAENATREDIFENGTVLSFSLAALGAVLVLVYALFFYRIYGLYSGSEEIAMFVLLLGLGTVCRLASDSLGAVLQVAQYIWLDNLFLVLADAAFPIATALLAKNSGAVLDRAGFAYLITGGSLVVLRAVASTIFTKRDGKGRFSWSVVNALITFGGLLTLANLADFLYAPTDFILINKLIDPATAGIYSPAVQIDAGLLLLVASLASVIFPRAAVAHAGGDVRKLQDYYVRGTLASCAILLLAAILVWLASPMIFRVWLHDPMTATQAILPLVLIHTVLGGSSGIGRSILLAMGKVKPFTTAVLCAGALNVVLSFAFVRYLHLGLRGIILGTIIAVILRCAVWMPWYVMKTLRNPV